MKLEAINPAALGAPKGYSNGILVRGDCDLLFVAGQIAWNDQQKIVSPDFAAQFDRALENVLAVVKEAKGKPEHIARFTMYVTDKREYLAGIKGVGAAYRARMGKHFPAMALVQVADLLEPGAKIEIEATAAIPRLRSNPVAKSIGRTLSKKLPRS
jgi:enamine deaminase RidA (YjgF/YER057c/UK114 family)